MLLCCGSRQYHCCRQIRRSKQTFGPSAFGIYFQSAFWLWVCNKAAAYPGFDLRLQWVQSRPLLIMHPCIHPSIVMSSNFTASQARENREDSTQLASSAPNVVNSAGPTRRTRSVPWAQPTSCLPLGVLRMPKASYSRSCKCLRRSTSGSGCVVMKTMHRDI